MKQLTFDQIRAATLGAARVCRETGGVRFYRFTEEEERVYRDRPLAPHLTGVYRKTFSTAGIKLSFRTDSRRLFLAVTAEAGGSSRSFFSLDVLVNGATKMLNAMHKEYLDKAIGGVYYRPVYIGRKN